LGLDVNGSTPDWAVPLTEIDQSPSEAE